MTAADRFAVSRDTAYLRKEFAPQDLFFGYDEAFAYGVLDPGPNAALGSARGTARSEGPLIVRSLERLHGPIAHGWYVALAHNPGRLAGVRARPRRRLRRRAARPLGARAHDQGRR